MGSVIYTGGTFDLFHPGHVKFLKACRKLAGRFGQVIIALNTDEFIEAYKGKSPVMSYEERKAVLLSCKYVDDVVPNLSGADSKPTIMSIEPDFIVIGDDWARKDYYAQMQFTQEWLEEQEVQLVYVPYTLGISTSDLKVRIASKQVK